MQLVVEPPPAWPELARRGFTLEVSPLVRLPSEVWAWLHAVVKGSVAEGETLDISRDERVTSALGWPCRLIGGAARPSGRVRIYAAYLVLGHGATVCVTAPSADELAASAGTVHEALLAGRPEWAGPEIAAAHEVWS